jgi:hypothetical protein
VLEWVDEYPFIPAIRLVEPFGFVQADGTSWTIAPGSVVDGRSLPPLFEKFFGPAFDGGFRKVAVVYDHVSKDMTQSWQAAQRMFFEASVVEGILPVEAKVMYLLLNATGPRWEIRGESSCFSHCHVGDRALAWRPLMDDDAIVALVSWVRDDDPDLDAIEAHVAAAILHPGLHIFGYVR